MSSRLADNPVGRDFIRAIIAEDLETGKHDGRVVTRFPPEPNGFLHIGHAKAICLDFGIAAEVPGARCHLRFDDTNPETEDVRYVEAIQEDVRWLGFDWGEHLYFASDYFHDMYAFAEHLVGAGKAYVDSQDEEAIRAGRGTITEPGVESPYRSRSAAESLELLRRMRGGEFPDGAHVLRARIDLASPNMLLRDPVLYRIRHAEHYRTGDDWCIYPLYDYAHSIEDALECVTHSLCTLEFETNRPLYDWVVEAWQDFARARGSTACRPRQYEFARLNLDYTVMSKRKLLELVKHGRVSGWDDPRMPTIAGLRRRGITPEAIRAFCELIGVAKADSRVDIGKLEYAVRDDLNPKVPRVLCVLRPLRVVITNYPEGQTEQLEASYYPHDVPKQGSRMLPFSRVLYIERDDFMEAPPADFYRLAPGREVRLRYAYFIRCDEVVKDEAGEIIELRCTYDPETRGGGAPDGRKVKGTIHWVSAEHSLRCEVRLYDRLFRVPDPDLCAAESGKNITEFLNPESLVLLKDARIEPSVAGDAPDTRYQFERQGYFMSDRIESRPAQGIPDQLESGIAAQVEGPHESGGVVRAEDSNERAPARSPNEPARASPNQSAGARLVFNRTVTLRDAWARKARGAAKAAAAKAAPCKIGQPARASGGGETLHKVPARPGAARERTGPTAAAPSRSPELEDRRRRYRDELGLPEEDADIVSRDRATAAFFDAALRASGSAKGAANWIINELPREIGERTLENLPFSGAELGALVALVEDGTLSSTAGREVLAEMAANGGDPGAIVERRGLRQISEPAALTALVEEVVAANAGKAAEYRKGKAGLLGFFMGQVMARTGGTANPALAKELLQERLART